MINWKKNIINAEKKYKMVTIWKNVRLFLKMLINICLKSWLRTFPYKTKLIFNDLFAFWSVTWNLSFYSSFYSKVTFVCFFLSIHYLKIQNESNSKGEGALNRVVFWSSFGNLILRAPGVIIRDNTAIKQKWANISILKSVS